MSLASRFSSLAVRLRGLSKSYGPITALQEVDLDLAVGEIHAIIGENGAGKSTLINILAGVETADTGSILLRSEDAELSLTQQSFSSSEIVCIPQEILLFQSLSIVENAFSVGQLPTRSGLISWREAARGASEILENFSRQLPIQRPVHTLSVPNQAMLQVSAHLGGIPLMIALDEPTAALGDAEVTRLFTILRELKEKGVCVLYVSHRLPEVLSIADRVTVLRNGEVIWTRQVSGLDEEQLIRGMIGQLKVTGERCGSRDRRGASLLEVKGLKLLNDFEVSFELHRGEVLGVCGGVGSGRAQLVNDLVGLGEESAQMVFRDSNLKVRSPQDLWRSDISYVPGERRSQGIFPGRSVRENLLMASLPKVASRKGIDRQAEQCLATELMQKFGIVAPSSESRIEELSGGNQQKVLLARALSCNPSVLIADEPTRGVDVTSRAQIHEQLRQVARSGNGVIVSSSDLPELMHLCHRILVLKDGSQPQIVSTEDSTLEELVAVSIPNSQLAVKTNSQPANFSSLVSRWWAWAVDWAGREMILFFSILLLALATSFQSPDLMTSGFWVSWLSASVPLVIAAAGMTTLMTNGGIDLSVGSMLAITAVVWVYGEEMTGSIGIGIGLAILAGCFLGISNGLLSRIFKLPAVVTTLATMTIMRGLFLTWTGGDWLALPEIATALARQGPIGLPWTVWISLVAIVSLGIYFHGTVPGRTLVAVGDSLSAARQYNLSVGTSRLTSFAVLGACTGLASVLHTCFYGRVQNNTGVGYELNVIAAAVIGGVAIGGGRGTILGATLGGLFLGLLSQVRPIWGFQERWQLIGVGAIMVLVIGLERLFNRE